MPTAGATDQKSSFTAINTTSNKNGGIVNGQKKVDDNQAIEGLSQAQIDAILAIANAGDDDSEDEDPEEPKESRNGDTNGVGAESEKLTQQSTDMSEALQRMITQLVSQHKGNSQEPADPYAPIITSVSDPYGKARSSAAALSSLLSESGVPMNTIIPAIQGRMASQLRQQSSDDYRPRPSTRRKVSAAYIESWGSPAEFNRRLLANPNAYSRPLNGALASSQSTGSVATKGSRPVLDSEKVKSFGKPPLGGGLLSS